MKIHGDGIKVTEQVFLDPNIPVKEAVVSHAHADHGATNSDTIHCTPNTKRLLEERFEQENIVPHEFEEPFKIDGCKVTLYPAGHVLGSAMICVEKENKTWLYTGDFKLGEDDTTKQAVAVQCDTLITETTFALPIYRWPSPHKEIDKVMSWYNKNKDNGVASVLFCYSLGKAQRVLSLLKDRDVKVYCHRTVRDMNKCYEDAGVDLGDWEYHSLNQDLGTKLFIAPKQVQKAKAIQKGVRTGFASGWMSIRGRRTWRGYDAGFTISDHADWEELCSFVKDCKPKEVKGVHGYVESFEKYCEEELL